MKRTRFSNRCSRCCCCGVIFFALTRAQCGALDTRPISHGRSRCGRWSSDGWAVLVCMSRTCVHSQSARRGRGDLNGGKLAPMNSIRIPRQRGNSCGIQRARSAPSSATSTRRQGLDERRPCRHCAESSHEDASSCCRSARSVLVLRRHGKGESLIRRRKFSFPPYLRRIVETATVPPDGKAPAATAVGRDGS